MQYLHYFRYTLLLLFMCCLFPAILCKGPCSTVGDCTLCKPEEMSNDYCELTNRKIKISCLDSQGISTIDYKACEFTPQDEQLRVIVFQVVVGVIGGFAYWGVQVRKRTSMTRFDSRKYQGRQSRY